MGVSTKVIGIKPADEKYKQMKKIWDSCNEAGIDVPGEVEEFFNFEEPDNSGIRVELKKDVAYDYSGYAEAGIEVDLSKLPKDIKILRFVNSW